MLRITNKNIFSLLLSFLFLSFFSPVNCQTSESVKKYDEILNKKLPDVLVPKQEAIEAATKQAEPEVEKQAVTEAEKNELTLLLPKLDNSLYQNWNIFGEAQVWMLGDLSPSLVTVSQELLTELGAEKALKQTYKKDDHIVNVLIYKFMDFTGAYSAYTVLHSGTNTKLKVGKNASESEKLVNFWKGNYFVDISTQNENDSIAKEFVILSSQDVSKNIQLEQLPPVVAIQLPALNRIQGSEKYCLGTVCCKEFISKIIPAFDCSVYDLQKSGGVISAEYQLSGNEKERITLALIRYTAKENAQSVFDFLRQDFEKKQKENKDIDIDVDIDESLIKIKNKKNDYTMLKQKGNLLAIAYGITSKKSGEQILGLVPWPIEVSKPINTQSKPVEEQKPETDKETEKH
ncbi:MAG: hypothetical protein HY094_02755 [Candidatus Melainabacteria bacterium]|nr:hypothetical protein [Candidatus Melainabacteria bacterium]